MPRWSRSTATKGGCNSSIWNIRTTGVPLPPGLGRFLVRHVDDYSARVPDRWLSHGGVMLPMYQSEAMWLNFDSPAGYPFAIRIAAGKIDAMTGEAWRDGLHRDPQDYEVATKQPCLYGYCVERGVIRQFYRDAARQRLLRRGAAHRQGRARRCAEFVRRVRYASR